MTMRITRNDFRKPQTWLSLIRIPFSAILIILAFLHKKWLFLALLIIIGLTDVLDGIIARKRNEAGPKGAWIDSLADHIFYPALFISTYILYPRLYHDYFLLVAYLSAWWVINFCIMMYRFKKPSFIHLNSVRFSVTAFFFFTIALIFHWHVDLLFIITLIIFSLRMAEETIVYSLMPPQHVNPDLRWFWHLPIRKKHHS